VDNDGDGSACAAGSHRRTYNPLCARAGSDATQQKYDSDIPEAITVGINRNRLFLVDSAKRVRPEAPGRAQARIRSLTVPLGLCVACSARQSILASYKYNEVGAWSANEERFAAKLGSLVSAERFIAETDRVRRGDAG